MHSRATTFSGYRPFRDTAHTSPSIYARPRIANKAKRMAAFFVDVLIYGALTSLLTVLFNVIGTTAASLLYASFHDCTMGAGRSLGRAAASQRLLRVDGTEVSHQVAIARNVIRWALWSTFLGFAVDLVLFFVGDGRLVADYIMGTQVSEDPRYAGWTSQRSTTSTSSSFATDTSFDPEIYAAERELDFDKAHHERDELDAFDEKLTAETQAVTSHQS